MEIPLQVTFRNMERAPQLEKEVRQKVNKLDEFFDRIVGCHVVVDLPHRHDEKGNIYKVNIHITVPRKELVVSHGDGSNHAHEDVHIAIRDAFDHARRQLEDYAREIRGDIKPHEVPVHGKVVKLFDDYGFVETSAGLEVYLDANSLVGCEFENLKVGDGVRFVLEEGYKGPQATSVHVLGQHHHIVG